MSTRRVTVASALVVVVAGLTRRQGCVQLGPGNSFRAAGLPEATGSPRMSLTNISVVAGDRFQAWA
ncbi:MAG: hypothetical protein MJD61_17470 [Proteobacteria bacterium]|nr:hypothetical protein [Pseudomonadota bacterium]